MADDARELTSLGLPAGARLCLVDLDGVLTDTAAVPTAARKQTDELLRDRSGEQE